MSLQTSHIRNANTDTLRLIKYGARALKTLSLLVSCIEQTRISNSPFVIRLTFPSSLSVEFHLHHSGDPEASVSEFGGGVSEKVEDAPTDVIPVDSWRCVVELRGSCKINSHRSDGCNLFVSHHTSRQNAAQKGSRIPMKVTLSLICSKVC